MAVNPMKANFRVNSKIEAFYTGGKVHLSKDGRHMFCSHDNKINILCVETGKVVHVIKQEDGDVVTCFAVSPDDEVLVVAYRNLLLMQWDWKEEQCTRTWKAIHRAPIVSMAFDSTSTLLATGSSDATVKVWDITRRYWTHNFTGSAGVISLVQFHPDPTKLQLYSASDDCKVRVWDLKTSRCCAVLDKHNSVVSSLSFGKEGATLITGGRDNIVIIWDIQGDKYTVRKTVPIYEAVEFVMMVPAQSGYETELNLTAKKGFHFITAGAQGILKVWNSESSRCVFEQKPTIAGKDVEAAITQAMYCSALDVIALVSYDHNILFHSMNGFYLTKQFVGYNEEILDVKFMGADCSHVAVASNSEQIRVFELSSHSCQILTGHTNIVLELDVFKNGLMMASCSKDNTVRLWRMDSDSGLVYCVAVGKGHTHSVGTVATSRLSNHFVVSGSEDQTIKVWSIPTDLPAESGKPLGQLKVKFAEKAHEKDINSVAISPNDKLLATGSQDRTAKLWDLDQEVMLGSFRGHKRGIWCVKFSPTDQALVTSSADGTIKIWALTNFSCVKTFEGHDASVMKVIFLTRGMQLLSCGSDGLLKLWTIKSNECIKTMDEHMDKVWTVAANGAENRIVSGGGDSNLIIWEDVTEVEEEEERAKMEDQLLKEQQLSNLLHDKKYLKAIGLAITLDQPFRLLNIVKTIMEETEGLEGLEKTLGRLRPDQIEATLRFAKQWNTNSKHCHTAQIVISTILKGNTPEELLSNPDMQPTLEGLIPYTERHFQRMNRLLQQAMFVEHTWQMMRRATAPSDSLIPREVNSELVTTAIGTTEGDQSDSLSLPQAMSEVKRSPGRSDDSSDESSGDSEDEEVPMTMAIAAKQVDTEDQNDSEESDSDEDNDEKIVTRTAEGQEQSDSSGVEEEMDNEVEKQKKPIKRKMENDDKENDLEDVNVVKTTALELGTIGVQKKKVGALKDAKSKKTSTPKAAAKKKTPSIKKTRAQSKMADRKTNLDDYISPRRTRSSNISTRLRKTSTSSSTR